jgi:hypothetical protein
MRKSDGTSAWLGRIALPVVGVVAMLSSTAVGQVSIDLLVDGADSVTVDPGQVDLAFDIQVNSTVDLSGVQYTLLSSNGDLFQYAANPIVTGVPFADGEKVENVSNPVAEGVLVSAKPDMGYFTFGNAKAAGSFPSVIATLNVSSVGAVADGTYTFIIGDAGSGFIWVGPNGNGTFDSSSIFTLVVGTGVSAGGGAGGLPLDTDGDGVPDTSDVCQGSNDNQDTDGDGVPDGCDNCSAVANPDQVDSDGNGIGDECESGDVPTTPDDGSGDDGTGDDGTGDDGTGDDGTGDDGTGDDGSGDDGTVVVPPPGGCGAGLVELSVMSLMSVFLVGQSRRRRVL